MNIKKIGIVIIAAIVVVVLVKNSNKPSHKIAPETKKKSEINKTKRILSLEMKKVIFYSLAAEEDALRKKGINNYTHIAARKTAKKFNITMEEIKKISWEGINNPDWPVPPLEK